MFSSFLLAIAFYMFRYSSPVLASNGYKNIAYFSDWSIYARGYHPTKLPIDVLTHVFYAFADVDSNGTVYFKDNSALVGEVKSGDTAYGCAGELFKLKQRKRDLKVILSVGGWSYTFESTNFTSAVSTAAGRSRFADTAVKLVGDIGFDGIDIDWEYANTTEKANDFVSLLEELRKKLDVYSETYSSARQLLAIAAPSGPENYKPLNLADMDQYVDLWNLMSYDYTGSFSQLTGHQANLHQSSSDPDATPFNTDQALSHYISHGIPPKKINLGIPLYGRAFTSTEGPGKSFQGVGPGQWDGAPGIWDYKALPLDGAQEVIDTLAGASYSYDPVAQELISYDTQPIIIEKAHFIAENGLGGGFFWVADGDRLGASSLMSTLFQELETNGTMDDGKNTILYPASRYANIRNEEGNTRDNQDPSGEAVAKATAHCRFFWTPSSCIFTSLLSTLLP